MQEAYESAKFIITAIYAVLAALASTAAGVVICAIQTVAVYLIGCVQVLFTRPSGLPDRQQVFIAPAGGDPARPSYFYGPARSDLRYIRQVAWSHWRGGAEWWLGTLEDMLDVDGGSRALTGPPAVGLAVGLTAGVPLAAAMIAAVSLAHEMLMGVATLSVRCTARALRAVDSALLRARHVKVRCVACFERIPYPAYLCPNPECRETHWDIRPGRYGVLRRTCRCGWQMPTLLLLGSARRLDAICPYRACKQPLEHRPGEGREIILPIFGSKGAGKTLLLYGIIKTLQASIRPGIHVDYADSATAARMRDLDSGLAEGFTVPATPAAELPKAYVLRLRIGRYRRIVQLLDAAGELFYDSQRSADLVLSRCGKHVYPGHRSTVHHRFLGPPAISGTRTARRGPFDCSASAAGLPADSRPDHGNGTTARPAPAGHGLQPSRPDRAAIRARGECGRRSPKMGRRRPGARRALARGRIGLPGRSPVPYRSLRQRRDRPDRSGPLAHASRRAYSPDLTTHQPTTLS